ncbi:hypothetical protein Scep_020087 [Stephania cephalantha]|uniref:Protein NUCLEAR FUSION DEFECTIVE 6, chloroplastic/mitochondrial-like n=1 Tax=Stephania cephalantha TaxID=152367 RepID=A0AAP0NMU3_9MAGN
MAVTHHARRAIMSSSSATKCWSLASLLSSSSSASAFTTATKLSGGLSSARISARFKPRFISRLPVELGCSQSLMPLHSVTASSLLTSMLSLKGGNWGWLSEGFATPL